MVLAGPGGEERAIHRASIAAPKFEVLVGKPA
jgi:hypothetical protein